MCIYAKFVFEYSHGSTLEPDYVYFIGWSSVVVFL